MVSFAEARPTQPPTTELGDIYVLPFGLLLMFISMVLLVYIDKRPPPLELEDQPFVILLQHEDQEEEDLVDGDWPSPASPGFEGCSPSEVSLQRLYNKIRETFWTAITDYTADILHKHCRPNTHGNARRSSVGQTSWQWGEQCFPLNDKDFKQVNTRRRHSTTSKVCHLRSLVYTPCLRCWRNTYCTVILLMVLVMGGLAEQDNRYQSAPKIDDLTGKSGSQANQPQRRSAYQKSQLTNKN